ncbi:hypothetical protein [Altericroceibacterium indicum]|nr:hypothetical protein [Altericroceibacterium indicum]
MTTEATPPRRRAARTKIRSEHRKGEAEKLNRHWRTLFLDCLADTSNVSAAARAAGIDPARAYKVRREERGFALQWQASLLEGYANLEMETVCRLRMGAAKDGRKFDIANALRLLAFHRENVLRERARQADEDEEAILASINAKIDQMRARQKAARDNLAHGDQNQPPAIEGHKCD